MIRDDELLDELSGGIGGAKPGEAHDLPVGRHAPVCAVALDNGGEMGGGFHEGTMAR